MQISFKRTFRKLHLPRRTKSFVLLFTVFFGETAYIANRLGSATAILVDAQINSMHSTSRYLHPNDPLPRQQLASRAPPSAFTPQTRSLTAETRRHFILGLNIATLPSQASSLFCTSTTQKKTYAHCATSQQLRRYPLRRLASLG